jgi:hypothetical protein
MAAGLLKGRSPRALHYTNMQSRTFAVMVPADTCQMWSSKGAQGPKRARTSSHKAQSPRSPDVQCFCLAPVADMLNHAPNVAKGLADSVEFDQDEDAVVLKLGRGARRKEEVCISYGSLDNAHLLRKISRVMCVCMRIRIHMHACVRHIHVHVHAYAYMYTYIAYTFQSTYTHTRTKRICARMLTYLTRPCTLCAQHEFVRK